MRTKDLKDFEITRTTIAALPGWYIALFCEAHEHEDKKCEDMFIFDAIVAWEIERHLNGGRSYHYTMPITLNGDTDSIGQQWCIKSPDGKFEFVEDMTCDTETEALVHARKRHEENERREAELKIIKSRKEAV